MFDLTVSGKITKVFGQLAEGGDYVFSMEEDYFSDGAVHVRYYNVYVTPNEYQRRSKLIVEGRRIGVAAYTLEIQWPPAGTQEPARLGVRASRLFIL